MRNGERVRCVCSTRAIVREDYLSIVCRSFALSLSAATATPVVQYLTSRPALFRGFCATREERRLRSRERERSLPPPHVLLFFGYLAESGPTPFRILTKIVTSYFASPPHTYIHTHARTHTHLHTHTHTQIHVHIVHRYINLPCPGKFSKYDQRLCIICII